MPRSPSSARQIWSPDDRRAFAHRAQGSGNLRDVERWAKVGGALVLPIVVATAAIFLIIWLFTVIPDDRSRLAQLGAMVIAAEAASGASLAALASQSSAEASRETARQAREALAIHFRPIGHWMTWSRYEWGGFDESPSPKPLILGEEVEGLGDQVKARFEFERHPVENIRFSYAVEGGPTVGPLSVTTDRLVDLPGVTASPKSAQYGGNWKINRAPTNIRWWQVEVYQPDGQMTWRASGTITDPTQIWRIDLDFQMVR